MVFIVSSTFFHAADEVTVALSHTHGNNNHDRFIIVGFCLIVYTMLSNAQFPGSDADFRRYTQIKTEKSVP